MNTKRSRRHERAFTCLLSLGMLAGVLIWAKLRLVTDIPRSALAVPEEVDLAVPNGGEIIDGTDESDESNESLEDVVRELQETEE